MTVSNDDRAANRYRSKVEDNIASFRLIYNTLSKARQQLLEAVLYKAITCTHLLEQVLPASKLDVLLLDFDGHRPKTVKDIQENPDKWSSYMIYLFAGSNISISLANAYLAVYEWNRGGFYTPQQPAHWYKDVNYPIREKELTEGSLQERVERLILRANEPLDANCGDMLAMAAPLD